MNLYKLIWRFHWEDESASFEEAYLLADNWQAVLDDAMKTETEPASWIELTSIALLDRNVNSARER